MTGLTIDAGGLIAIDRGVREATLYVKRAIANGVGIVVPAGVLAQVWRDGRTQVLLARFLVAPEVSIEVMDERRARAVGALCGLTKTRDVVDASVVFGARHRGDHVMTSDPDDLLRLAPQLSLIVV